MGKTAVWGVGCTAGFVYKIYTNFYTGSLTGLSSRYFGPEALLSQSVNTCTNFVYNFVHKSCRAADPCRCVTEVETRFICSYIELLGSYQLHFTAQRNGRWVSSLLVLYGFCYSHISSYHSYWRAWRFLSTSCADWVFFYFL